jgi:hypothetical protein
MGSAHRRKLARACWLGLSLTALAACTGGAVTGTEPQPPDIVATDPPHLYRSLQSGVDDEARIIIQDASAWQAFWRQLVQGAADAPAQPPSVDFNVQVVVVAALGSRERAGYHIAITAYQRNAGQTHITILKTAPPADCPSSPVITTPIALTAVARGTSYTFREIEEATSCPD